MARAKFRGHDIETDIDDLWVFADTGQLVSEDKNNRPCSHCKKNDTQDGHDGCLGTLKGLMNACCGHGVESDAYIQFLDCECLRGKPALIVIEQLRKI